MPDPHPHALRRKEDPNAYADPDPGFDDQKLEKKLQLKKIYIFLIHKFNQLTTRPL
jgi:hypothetical protein